MRIPLTRYAVPEILLFCGFFIAAAVLCLWSFPVLTVLPLCGLAFILNFFRDPDRTIPGGLDVVVSPADGTVTDITKVAKCPYIGGPAERVGIFLSVFDVHVNRVPLGGTVEHCEHRPGAYLDARDLRCADENEAVDLGMEAELPEGGRVRVMIRQIAGLIARRILCPVEKGRVYEKGERYGMIRFGSRTEVYLPAGRWAEINVKVGDKVKGGMTVIGRVSKDPQR